MLQGDSVDVVIFGGGAAGLWLLDELVRAGRSTLLLESRALGSGQTVASQGIIHGGLKYTLQGLLTGSADAIKDMPQVWRQCLAGERLPNLQGTAMRSQSCVLWHTASLTSRLGMFGAKTGLRVMPVTLPRDQWPAPLRSCKGEVVQLDEQVLSPASFIQQLAKPHAARLVHYREDSVHFETAGPGQVQALSVQDTSEPGRRLRLKPGVVVLTAGEGNEKLRTLAGLAGQAMQRRPLHMVMGRGDLPVLNGHCVDGMKTRVTITTDRNAAGEVIWQVGGQVAEEGVNMDREALVAHTLEELRAVMPGWGLKGTQWSTYRVNRAEPWTRSGLRPEGVHASREGNLITAWPTKLVLAPVLADKILAMVGPAANPWPVPSLGSYAQPAVALPPWETEATWITAS